MAAAIHQRKSLIHVRRFLHVRILVLRPALETLFLRRTNSQNGASLRNSMSIRIQESMLLDIAAQCVHLAEILVDVYSRLGFGSYGAWWYNISRESACYCAGLMVSTDV